MQTHKRITAFGEVMMRLSVPNYETLSQSRSLTYSFTGTGVNISAGMARLGHEASIVTTVPDNSLGDAAMASLRALNLNTRFVRAEGSILGSYFLETGYGARPTRVTYGSRKNSSFNSTAKDVYNAAAIAENTDCLHLCGIGLAMNANVRYQMKSLAEKVRSAGGSVVFDCNYRSTLWDEEERKHAKSYYEEMLHLADIVMMNERDAISLLGYQSSYEGRTEQLQELIPMIASKYAIRIIAGTQRTIGPNDQHMITGFMYKNDMMKVGRPMNAAVLDRVGAGDAYTAGIMHGDISGYEAQYAVQFATAASILAHTVPGDTAALSEQDIIKTMQELAPDIER